jgi:hypothetical protein
MYIGNETQSNLLGWAAAAVLGAQIALPFVMRRMKNEAGSGVGVAAANKSPSTWPLSWLHYLLGFVLPAAAFVHAWIPMASGKMPQTSMTGLWLATYALGLMVLQVVLGLVLQRVRGVARVVIRRVHFVGMLIISLLVLAHIAMN